ncbi:ABC transporter permease [Photobacterium profundum]|uniref:Putative permease of ABC transporter n=1 Tax=Photobacterium profundum 3TCK TaxID=314280 RepID=Q1ZAG9_9GAMM|nr:ABC transporter permease subunit [Photobacterium profundum]EAS45523.1 putative permease of ABC transporter [Photobacterium profundum 3TCK]PSV63300.1 ABC transporter permease [Photobacterium profundum]
MSELIPTASSAKKPSNGASVSTVQVTARFKPQYKSHYKHWRPALLLLPFSVVFFFFQLAPMIWVFVNSFIYDESWSVEHYHEIFDSDFLLQSFGNSMSIAMWSSVVGLAIATVGVASLRRVDCKIRDWVVAFTNMASNFSGVPLAFAFVIILGFNGAITLLLKQWGWIDDFNLYSKTGLTFIYIYFQIPLAMLLLYPAFDALRDDWEEAAALLGANKWRYWLHIALPVLSPALLGTLIILIANAMGAYASAYALTTGNYNLVTIRIASLVSGDLFLEPNLAAALSVLLMIILGFVTAINQWLLKRSYHAKR